MTRLAKASLLLFFFSLCGVAAFVTHRWNERRPPPQPRELFAVVNDQLAAFRASDFPGAYRYSSTGVQQKFTLAQFEEMVRRNYAEMANATRVEFGSVKIEGRSAVVQVFFFRRDGSVRTFLYSLLSEEGQWRIGGVQEIEEDRSSQELAGTSV